MGCKEYAGGNDGRDSNLPRWWRRGARGRLDDRGRIVRLRRLGGRRVHRLLFHDHERRLGRLRSGAPASGHPPPDALAKIVHGDPEVARELHEHVVLGRLEAPVGAHDLDEVVQEIFLQLLRRRDRDGEGAFLAEVDDLVDLRGRHAHLAAAPVHDGLFGIVELAVDAGGGDEGAHRAAGVDVYHGDKTILPRRP